MAVALIVAAGRGERLGLDRPKALVMLAGRPMLQWSVDALRMVPAVKRIVVAMPASQLAAAPTGTTAVAGGTTRSESVRAALRAATDGDPIVVHDAARPLASPELFERALRELEQHDVDGVVAAAPVSDTIKQVGADGYTVHATLERSRLWAIQTPQVFKRAALTLAFEQTPDELLAAATDDAWLVERVGGIVRVVRADTENLKVTSRLDLRLAELLLAERGSRPKIELER
jgi:2-C-methyl-D-erythritol 4-phosphate cytidylyltransferase